MSLNNRNFTCWIVTEGMAGTQNQCIGVAQALGVEAEVKTIQLRQPWKALSPLLGFEQSWSFVPTLKGPWPDLLLTSGRKSIAAARYIKHASGGKTFSVHLQDPRINPAAFDLVAVPAHDPTRGDNVIVTKAAANKITPEILNAAKDQFGTFETIKSPRVAVLIGGSSKAYKMTPDITRRLCKQLKEIKGGLMITTSRRTGAENEAMLRSALADTDAYIWDGRGENPYMGMLAWADYILVTADSVSMLSDACSTGKPVYMIPLDGGAARIDKLHSNLRQSGCLKIFDGTLEHWDYTPLDDAQTIAAEILKRMSRK